MSDGGGPADDDADAIREHQLKLQAAATKARAEKRRAEIIKAARAHERAREVLKSNCWECWKTGQDVIRCTCIRKQNVKAYFGRFTA